MGSRGRDSYGKAGREAAATVDAIATLVDGFDPDRVLARDALDLVSEFSRLEHLASAGVALAARKVAQTELWRRGGHRSPAHWLSHTTGMSVGEALGLLETAETVESAPDTFDAFKEGRVSTRQARAIGAAENADPAAGRRLLDVAEQRSTKETTDAAARIVRAASTESDAERAERVRRSRFLRTWVDADGAGHGSFLLPPAEFTRLMAALDGRRSQVFDQARLSGARESSEAYAADALAALADTPVSRTGDAGDGWHFAKAIVRVDLTALDRGELAPGEVCEVAGRGPIPVADAWKMIDGDAFVAAITTRGTEIDKVVHFGRKPTALQKTALEWLSAGECSIEGCTNPARIEIDHVADWADTHITTLPDLASPCGHHHDLKTHHGHTFGPRLPSGKRRLIPPDSADPPDKAFPKDSEGVRTEPPHGHPPTTNRNRTTRTHRPSESTTGPGPGARTGHHPSGRPLRHRLTTQRRRPRPSAMPTRSCAAVGGCGRGGRPPHRSTPARAR